MGNCGSSNAPPPAVEDDPGARDRQYSPEGTRVLFDRIDALKTTQVNLEQDLAAMRKRANDFEAQAATAAAENEQLKKEQEEVHSVVRARVRAVPCMRRACACA
jgi:hypothetical protein